MLCLLVLSLTLSTTVGEENIFYMGKYVYHNSLGRLDSECLNTDHMPGHFHFYTIARQLGSYGRQSVDDMVIELLCMFAISYPHETGCVHHGPSDNQHYNKANTNKTFFQRLVPLIQNIEENLNRSSEYIRRCPIPNWNPADYIPDMEDTLERYYHTYGETYGKMLKSYRDNGISVIFQKLLKALNMHNVEAEQELMEEAVETVLGSSSVNPMELIALHLRKPDEESKSVVKMVLAKYISSYLTADRVRCFLKELTRNKFLTYPQSPDSRVVFNLQNVAVNKTIYTTTKVIEKDGTLPYINLAHALVDELGHLKIPQTMNTQYINFLKSQNLFSTIPWNDGWKSLVKASSPLYQVFKSLICDENEILKSSDTLKQLFQNIKTESSDAWLDYYIKALLNIVPAVLTEIGEEKLQGWDCEECDDPSYITSFLMANQGIFGTLLNTEIELPHRIKYALRYTIDTASRIYRIGYIRIFENISKHLLKDLSMQEKKMIQEPLRDLKEFVSVLFY